MRWKNDKQFRALLLAAHNKSVDLKRLDCNGFCAAADRLEEIDPDLDLIRFLRSPLDLLINTPILSQRELTPFSRFKFSKLVFDESDYFVEATYIEIPNLSNAAQVNYLLEGSERNWENVSNTTRFHYEQLQSSSGQNNYEDQTNYDSYEWTIGGHEWTTRGYDGTEGGYSVSRVSEISPSRSSSGSRADALSVDELIEQLVYLSNDALEDLYEIYKNPFTKDSEALALLEGALEGSMTQKDIDNGRFAILSDRLEEQGFINEAAVYRLGLNPYENDIVTVKLTGVCYPFAKLVSMWVLLNGNYDKGFGEFLTGFRIVDDKPVTNYGKLDLAAECADWLLYASRITQQFN